MLKPDEYESLGMPIGYVYWASVNTFVHISHIPPQYLDVHGQPIFPFNVPISDPYHFPTKRVLDKKSEPMEILTSVMKIKPYKPNQVINSEHQEKIFLHYKKKKNQTNTAYPD